MLAHHHTPAAGRKRVWSSRMRRTHAFAGLLVAGVTAIAGCTSSAGENATGSQSQEASRPDGTALKGSVSAKADGERALGKQCTAALTSAEQFLPTWKSLANQGTSPTLEQRQALGAEIQSYIDQLAKQLPGITDPSLAADVQALQGQMGILVSSLNAGVVVDLAAYNAAIAATKTYCGK